MKIILLKGVRGLGRAGDIKKVKGGYARNFLIPRGLADLAIGRNINRVEGSQKKKDKDKRLEVRNKKMDVKRINGQNFQIKVKADKGGTLYAGVDAGAVAKELAKRGWRIEPEEIKLKEAIKRTGDYLVELKMGGEKAKVRLKVSGK